MTKQISITIASIELKMLKLFVVLIVIMLPSLCKSQTEFDAIMMNKNQLCSGISYTTSSWTDYWEGTFKRDNDNLGKVSTQSLMLMTNYGITDNLNVMASVPYVWTEASKGTLRGMKGVQDLSLFIKWKALQIVEGKNKLSVFAIGGISTPLSDYVIDFLPLSIGLGSTNLTARAMVDYQIKKINVTGSAAYIRRSNVTLDRNSYFDTELHLTNEVRMPHAAQYQLRAGYRGKYLLAEALLTNWTTIGGFDITKNNMPFPSNRMNATMIGMNVKYTLKNHVNFSFLATANYTIAGRNVGQSNAVGIGALYAFYVKKKQASK